MWPSGIRGSPSSAPASAASLAEAVYGAPPAALIRAGPEAMQVSPLIPGGAEIEALGDGSLQRFVVAAPPGTLERRYVLAHALRALAEGGELIALAPKDRGGARLGRELAAFGCAVVEEGRRHHRICRARRPAAPSGVAEAIAAGGPRFSESLGLWTQPGIFSWDRIDPGTALLLGCLGGLSGAGVDLGCGYGVLSRRLLDDPAVRAMTLADIDRRAVAASGRNLAGLRAEVLWTDVRDLRLAEPADFVVINPAFHAGGREDRDLGRAFIAAAAGLLRRGGVCRLVANRTLPYEDAVAGAFRAFTRLAEDGGYKVLEAVR